MVFKMDYHKAVWKSQICVVILASITLQISAVTPTNHRPSSSPIHPTDPHYRFRYLVKDEKNGEYKALEEFAEGDNVTGSYIGDLKVFNYTADNLSGFKANVNVQPGAAPVKMSPITDSTVAPPFGGLLNNFYRSSIPPLMKNHKPLRDINPIVVKSLTMPPVLSLTSSRQGNPTLELPQQPYAFYRESRNDSSTVQGADVLNSIRQLVHVNSTSSNITAAEKIETPLLENVEMKSTVRSSEIPAIVTPAVINTENKSYDLQSMSFMEKMGLKSFNSVGTTPENVISNRHLPYAPPANNINHMHKMDIPASIAEILIQNKAQMYTADYGNTYSLPPGSTFTDMNILRSGAGISENLIKPTENKMNNTLPSQKDKIHMFVPQRPMRLIGLNPMYVDNVQLQSITENLTMPQFHWEPLSNIQYVAPIPLHHGPLPFGPLGPFHSVPRSVNEPSSSDIPSANALPLLNSIAISAPVIPQSLPAADIKPDLKSENKPIPSPFVLCSDCLMPSNYMTYPIVRIPTSASAPLPASSTPPLLNPISAPSSANQPNTNANGQKSPCTNNVLGSVVPSWTSYPQPFPSAYILLPTPMLKNRINDTRTLSAKIFT